MELSEFGIRPKEDWAALILPRVFSAEGRLLGYIFIVDPSFGNALPKLPSGRKKEGKDQSPFYTALRELPEESGCESMPQNLRYIGKRWETRPSPHWKCLFVANLSESERDWMYNPEKNPARPRPPGNEGEVADFYSVEDARTLVSGIGFFFRHRQELEYFGILPELTEGRELQAASL